MPAFDISTSENEVEIGADGKGRALFTVANQIGKRILARAELLPIGSTSGGWLSIEGKRERAFGDKAEEIFTVVISPDADAAPGRYAFRLRMVTTSESASEFAHTSEPIAFDIKAPEPPPEEDKPKPKPETQPPPRNIWKIVAIGLLVLDLVLAIVAMILLFGGTERPNGPGPTPSPSTPSTPPPTEQVVCVPVEDGPDVQTQSGGEVVFVNGASEPLFLDFNPPKPEGFDTSNVPPLGPAASFQVVFPSPGTFTYICVFDVSAVKQVGTVTVLSPP